MDYDAVAESGRNPVSRYQIHPECGEVAGWREGAAEPISRGQTLRCEQGQGKNISLFS